jgi:Bacterial Ig-like domain (group 3)
MAPTQPFPRVPRTLRTDAFLRGLAISCILLVGLVLTFPRAALAQGGVPLVTVATDQSSLNLSNQFGVPASTAINQAGDFAFVGNGSTALFFRAAGASAATRLLQIDDEAPGFPGSQILSFMPELGINASRSLLFGVRFSASDNEPHAALLIYDGSNYHTVVASDGIAPGSSGATYGFNLTPGSINDNGDVSFAAVVGSTTFYIVPVGKPAVRIVGLGDTPPAACTWCGTSGSLEKVFAGNPTNPIILGDFFVPRLNSQGQMLLEIWGGLFIGSKDGGFTLVPMASAGACSPQPISTVTSALSTPGLSGFLNNSGVVAFTNPSSSGSAAICVAPAGGGSPSPATTAADPAPGSVGGTMTSPVALGLDDSGDIVFQSPISGSSVTTYALLRYHPSNVTTDVVAYNCQPAPGTNGSSFSPFLTTVPCGPAIVISTFPSPFRGVSIANDGSVSLNASLSSGGNAIYRQTGAAAPEFISFDFNGNSTIPFGVGVGSLVNLDIFSLSGQTQILNNGSVFFATYLTSGAADFAVRLGTPGSVQSLMSTADVLPSGARTILGSTPPQAAGHFVAFTAQPAAGRINLLESDLTSGVITRIVSDNDPSFATAGGPAGNTVVAPNFFLNESGQVAFEAVAPNTIISGIGVISFGSGSVNSAWLRPTSTCGTIYLWSPSGGLTKVAAAGDAAPNSSAKFSCVTLNSGPPSPLNSSGQLAFTSPSPFPISFQCFLCGLPAISPGLFVNGVYLYSPGGGISEVAAANDTLPGQTQATSGVPYLSVPVNSPGQVAFGAQVGTTSQGFFLQSASGTHEVIANGDSVPGTNDTFGFPHFIAGLANNGNFAFTAATGTAADGLFLAPAGGAIQTLALDGSAAPVSVGGTFSLASGEAAVPNPPPGTILVGINSLKNFAAINGESDVAFGASITGGSADSGLFRVLQSDPTSTLQPVVLQGQTAPGGGTFTTINLFSNLGGNFAFGPDGTLAFVNPFISASGTKLGMFVARPDGALLKVAATGDFLPGGGVLAGLSMSPRLAAGDPGKFAFSAGIVGGSARRAVFVTAIPPGTASTTTTLSPLQSPAVAQQSIMLTAAVTSTTAGNPTGTVNFSANGISLGTSALNPSGQATLTTSSLAAGQDSLVAQYDGDSNFAPGNSAPMAVVVAGFAPPPAQLTVSPGNKLVIPLTLFAPAGSTMSFMLSCSGLPANASCMFDMNPVMPGPSGTTVNLTVTTMMSSKLPAVQPLKGPPALPGFGLAALLALFFAAAAPPWRRAPRWRFACCACLATFTLALVIGGCGASSYSSNTPLTPGTPAGPASITVTGTSGATMISTVVKVTVQ